MRLFKDAFPNCQTVTAKPTGMILVSRKEGQSLVKVRKVVPLATRHCAACDPDSSLILRCIQHSEIGDATK